jgi:hypothetical protein
MIVLADDNTVLMFFKNYIGFEALFEVSKLLVFSNQPIDETATDDLRMRLIDLS